MKEIIANENKQDLFYALAKASYDSNLNDNFCWFMSYKDYERVRASLLNATICLTGDMLEDGNATLFGYPIKIRDELKHIYIGIEMDEVNDETKTG